MNTSRIETISSMKELPEKPEGWTRRMLCHMNFGGDGGAATFEIIDTGGNTTPIGYQYDTRKNGLTGYTLPNVEGVMTRAELRDRWPEWNKEAKS